MTRRLVSHQIIQTLNTASADARTMHAAMARQIREVECRTDGFMWGAVYLDDLRIGDRDEAAVLAELASLGLYRKGAGERGLVRYW